MTRSDEHGSTVSASDVISSPSTANHCLVSDDLKLMNFLQKRLIGNTYLRYLDLCFCLSAEDDVRAKKNEWYETNLKHTGKKIVLC